MSEEVQVQQAQSQEPEAPPAFDADAAIEAELSKIRSGITESNEAPIPAKAETPAEETQAAFDLAAFAEEARQNLEKRRGKPAETTVAPPITPDVMADFAKQMREITEARAKLESDIQAFMRDPLSAASGKEMELYERIKDRATNQKAAEAKTLVERQAQEIESLRKELAQMKDEFSENLTKMTKTIEQQRMEESVAHTVKRYDGYVQENAQRFPLTSRLSKEERIDEGRRIAQEFGIQGTEDDFPLIVGHLELRLQERLNRLGATLQGAPPNGQTGLSAQPPQKDPAKVPAPPLSNALGATTAMAHDPMSDEQREAMVDRMIADLQESHRAASS